MVNCAKYVVISMEADTSYVSLSYSASEQSVRG